MELSRKLQIAALSSALAGAASGCEDGTEHEPTQIGANDECAATEGIWYINAIISDTQRLIFNVRADGLCENGADNLVPEDDPDDPNDGNQLYGSFIGLEKDSEPLNLGGGNILSPDKGVSLYGKFFLSETGDLTVRASYVHEETSQGIQVEYETNWRKEGENRDIEQNLILIHGDTVMNFPNADLQFMGIFDEKGIYDPSWEDLQAGNPPVHLRDFYLAEDLSES